MEEQAQQQQQQEVQPFSLRYKQIFMTYSQIDPGTTKESLLRYLRQVFEQKYKINIERYVVGREHHEDEGIHYHVFIELQKRPNLRIKNQLNYGQRPNIQKCQNVSDVIKYCIKHEDYITSFDAKSFIKQNKKSKEQAFHQLLFGEEELQTWIYNNPKYIPQYSFIRQGLNQLKMDKQQAYTAEDVRGIWIYGNTGVGKSTYAQEISHPDNIYNKDQTQWFNGYNGQSHIVIEDLDRNDPDVMHNLKIWADKWPCTGQTKGGYVPLQHKYLIVTSNFAIRQLFKNYGVTTLDALERRFSQIRFDSIQDMEDQKKKDQPPSLACSEELSKDIQLAENQIKEEENIEQQAREEFEPSPIPRRQDDDDEELQHQSELSDFLFD